MFYIQGEVISDLESPSFIQGRKREVLGIWELEGGGGGGGPLFPKVNVKILEKKIIVYFAF